MLAGFEPELEGEGDCVWVTGTWVVKVLPPEVMTVCIWEVTTEAPEPEAPAKMVLEPTVLVRVEPLVVMVVRTGTVEMALLAPEAPEAPPAAPKMVLDPIVLVMVEPPEVMVVRTGTVEMGVLEALAPPATPKMVLEPMVLVMVEPPEVMVVTTGTVEMGLLEAPLAPVAPLGFRVEVMVVVPVTEPAESVRVLTMLVTMGVPEPVTVF